MDTDMDMVMAYKQLPQHTKHTVKFQWVMGHVDEKKKTKPETIMKLEGENIECDEDTNNCVDQTTEVTSLTPLPGYMTMLKFRGNWVMTHFRENVKVSNTSPEMVLHILK